MSDLLKRKYNFSEIEDKWKKYWDKEKLYEFKFDEKKPPYVVDTPPPYVSADHLHVGHIMSYSQAEFVVRYKRMQGFNVFYPMGFDDNGLPTERFVEKKYKVDKKKISKSEFIKLCLKETEKGSETYKNLWTNLGISVDWSKTYSTISPKAQKVSQWSLIDLYKKGHLYRKKMPIMWCPKCMTAIAQADLEDQEDKAKMNYINFKQKDSGKDLPIATTRPELIAACVALYVNPKDKRFKDLVGKKAIVPLFNYEVPIKTSETVEMEKGTGLMMVCTWGDQEDLEKWAKDDLDSRPLLEEDGRLNELGGEFKGMKVLTAREKIIERLKQKKFLVKQEDKVRTLNIHERCSTPMEIISSQQWFVKITDKEEEWMEYTKKLNWYPKSSAKIYETWVKSLKWDWCVSRQRYFGVPIPVWYCKKCNEPIFAKEKDLPVNPLEDKPPVDKCPKCAFEKLIPEEDVMDTWATSACTPFLLRELVKDKKIKKELFPATLRPNGYDIIRTWDFYSIVKSHYNFDSIPFEDMMISGHGLDEHGRKISKRLGNYVPSDKLLSDYGADAIRYWATGATLAQNLRFSEKEVKKGNRTNIKLWNVGRFVLMQTLPSLPSQERHFQKGTFDSFGSPRSGGWGFSAFDDMDLWILEELNETISKATEGFEKYTYSQVKNEVDAFFWNKFADYYIEFLKYRLNGDDKESKQAAVSTLFIVFLNILKLYAPMLPFITEELYQELYREFEGKKSIHISKWPKKIKIKQKFNRKEFEKAIAAIDEIRAYKSRNGISLGKEIEEYQLKTKVDLKKYKEFIKGAIKVKKLI
ncbi:MAG: valine--tRNA ligase [Candidatus Moranbacteria bacterium]|nr:valine--tRNA ligase [Candidatus Moranbacteria bacterium]